MTRNGIDFPDDHLGIFLCDSGADQCMLSAHHFMVISETDEFYEVHGCMQSMHSGNALRVVTAGSIAVLPGGRRVALIVNQGLFNPDESHKESLLQPQQIRDYNFIVDDVPKVSIVKGGASGGQ